MPRHYVIIGAGISGLALGWYLQQQNHTVTLIEKSKNAGGWVRTTVSEGFLFEQGPRSLRPHDATLELIRSLNLEDQVIQADPSAKKRYLYMNQELKSIPFSFLTPLARAAWKDLWTPPPTSIADESVHCFFSRHFGFEIAETFGDAMISGIFAGDPKQLSLKCCFPTLHEWELKHGSIVKALFKEKKSKGSIYSFKNGMQTLTDALASRLNIEYSCCVSNLEPCHNSVKVTLSDQRIIAADHVFFAIPPTALGQLIPQLAPELNKIPCVSVATVNMGYREQKMQKKGFGYLVPSSEKESILGVVFDSCAFPDQNRHPNETRLTVMLGGTRDPNVDHYNSNKIEAIALQAVEDHLGIKTQPDSIQVRVAHHAIPQYLLGHAERIHRIETQLREISPHYTLAGNGFYGISINDCITRGSASGLRQRTESPLES